MTSKLNSDQLSGRGKLLSVLWPHGYLLIFWCAVWVGCLWCFKLLWTSTTNPGFCLGMFTGAIWALVVVGVSHALIESADELLTEVRSHVESNGE